VRREKELKNVRVYEIPKMPSKRFLKYGQFRNFLLKSNSG